MKKFFILFLLLISLNVKSLELESMKCQVIDSKILKVSSGNGAKDPKYGNQWDKGEEFSFIDGYTKEYGTTFYHVSGLNWVSDSGKIHLSKNMMASRAIWKGPDSPSVYIMIVNSDFVRVNTLHCY